MHLADRYASSIVSSNLRVEARVSGDADMLVASGWAGTSSSLAALIHRARVEHDRGAGSRSAQRPAMAALEAFIAKQAALTGIDLTDAARWLTKGVMLVLLKPACAGCRGIAFKVIPGSTHLSDEVCGSCLGTGRRKFNARTQAQADLADRALALIDMKVQAHARRMARRLRG